MTIKKLLAAALVVCFLCACFLTIRANELYFEIRHSGQVADVRFGNAQVTIDGTINNAEWSDAQTITIPVRSGTATVYFKEDGSNLFIAFDIPDNDLRARDNVTLCVDVAHLGGTAPQPDDLMYNITWYSAKRRYVGTGLIWTEAASSGWAAASNYYYSCWWAEIRISYTEFGIVPGQARTLGAEFVITDAYRQAGRTQIARYYWSQGGNMLNPNSWGDMVSSDNWTSPSGQNLATQVIVPDGGEVWSVGQQYEIWWGVIYGTSPYYVNLSYSTTGSSGTFVAINTIPIRQNSAGVRYYPWTIPNTPSTDCYVRVEVRDSAQSIAEDKSDSAFTITTDQPMSVSVDANPQLIQSGGTSTIRVEVEDSSGAPISGAQVKLESDDGGTFNPQNGPTNSQGIFTSTFTAPVVSQPKQITIYANVTKPQYLPASESVTVLVMPLAQLIVDVVPRPETVNSSETATIMVYVNTTQGPVPNANVQLTPASGSCNPTSGTTDTQGIFVSIFTAPVVSSTTRVQIRADATATGANPGTGFTNVTVNPGAPALSITLSSPNGGEYWENGTTHNIIWTVANGVPPYTVALDYSISGTNGPWLSITPNAVSPHSWKVPYVQGTKNNCFIRATVTDSASHVSSDWNDAAFTIFNGTTVPKLTITVLKPHGNENWTVGQRYRIEWTVTGGLPPYSVALDYSTTGKSGLYSPITSALTGTFYDWLVPTTIQKTSTNCFVRATVTDRAGNTDISWNAENFTIYKPEWFNSMPRVEILYPKEGEILQAGSMCSIVWNISDDRPFPPQPVNITFSSNGGLSWTEIATFCSNRTPNSYDWSVPHINSSSCKIKVDVYDSGSQHSNATTENFTITTEKILAYVIVYPEVIDIIYQGEKQQFTAKGYDRSGAEIPDLKFIWSVWPQTLGEVNTSGEFIAGTANVTGFVNATATSGGVSATGSASVNVTVISPVLTSVTITQSVPPPYFVDQKVQFIAQAYNGTKKLGGEVIYNWSLTENLGTLNPQHNSQNTIFTAARAGSGSVVVSAWYHGTERTATAEIEVRERPRDTSPPIITNVQAPSSVREKTAIIINATVTDNVKVADVKLYYKKMHETSYYNLSMHPRNGNIFTATIDAEFVTEDIQFYIMAKDNATPQPNIRTYPESNPQTNPITISVIIYHEVGGGGGSFLPLFIALIIILVSLLAVLLYLRSKHKRQVTDRLRAQQIAELQKRRLDRLPYTAEEPETKIFYPKTADEKETTTKILISEQKDKKC